MNNPPSRESTVEQVVLVDDDGAAIGVADKSEVHTAATPLHLAFSCHLFNPDGQILVTRRALSKQTWPGVWTNSFCGHPAPGETTEEAVIRRAPQELGVAVTGLKPILPDFRYRALDASGVVENEICPVYTALLETDPQPAPDQGGGRCAVGVQPLAGASAAVACCRRTGTSRFLTHGILPRTKPSRNATGNLAGTFPPAVVLWR
jgi:isopentenyl-diphosphate delta-isomerase